MSVVDSLFEHNVTITIPGGEQLQVDLSANPWNRTTIADGYWLQSKTVYPFSARDIYLANCIDSAFGKIGDIEDAISNGTINSLISMNNVIYSANDYWEGLPATVAPSDSSKAAPSNTLTYMTLGQDSDIATEDISLKNDRTCIIQGNLTENSFNQLLMTDGGIYYRSVSGDETTTMTGEKVDSYDLLDTNKGFSQILDDSTIDDPGYWFLHKESSGRPVWTNINALGDYIDNRVNPDGVYVGWSANGPDAELSERKLVLYPPNENNTTTAIDPTSDTYTNNAYTWTEQGWAALPPIMSREEVIERIDEGVTANNALKDFLSLFTANGAQAHYTNYGYLMRSECEEDGNYYFTFADTQFYLPDGRNRTWAAAAALTEAVTAFKVDDISTTYTAAVPNTCKFGNSGTINDYYYVSNPIYIELAPFVFTDDEKNIPRDWNIHFCIKGMGEFCSDQDDITPPAYVDVSIIWTTATPTTTFTEWSYDTSKTYFITKGDCIASKSNFVESTWSSFIPDLDTNKINMLSASRTPSIIAKEIDYHQSFSAGAITSTAYTPYLRVCIKGISSTSDPGTLQEPGSGLGIEIAGNRYFNPYPASYFGHSRFIEEFTDDRFMDYAYKYVNNLPTRRLSYTDASNEENLLGINAANPTLTENTNVLGQ